MTDDKLHRHVNVGEDDYLAFVTEHSVTKFHVSVHRTSVCTVFIKRHFRNICKSDSCLHHLLQPPRDLAVTSRLRKPTVYPRPSLRTKRYCSAVSYALLNF